MKRPTQELESAKTFSQIKHCFTESIWVPKGDSVGVEQLSDCTLIIPRNSHVCHSCCVLPFFAVLSLTSLFLAIGVVLGENPGDSMVRL